jgi:cell wall-associated NlpC family hydrolase
MTADAAYVVRSPVAPLLAEPRISSELISQRLAGHRVEVVERRAPWIRVRGQDGYAGWTHEGYLRRQARDDSGATRTSLGCAVVSADGQRRQLPLGAVLSESDRIESGAALDAASLARRFPRDGAALAESAATLFSGTPYLWGGITPWGADCSGFVQSCFALHGVALPRDARDQVERGADPRVAIDALRPADLLFFSEREDGRVTHVGVALGAGRMAHVALGRGGFAIERLSSDEPYVATLRSRFRGARRIELG